jgi:hypothetical protein
MKISQLSLAEDRLERGSLAKEEVRQNHTVMKIKIRYEPTRRTRAKNA